MAFSVGTPGGLSSADASALMANLKNSAPPINPSTAPIRRDATQDRYRALKQIQVACEKCLLTINDDELPLKSLITTTADAMNKLLAGVDPTQVIQSIGQLFAPPPPPPMMGPAPMGAPPPGMAPAAPPPVAPPMGAPGVPPPMGM